MASAKGKVRDNTSASITFISLLYVTVKGFHRQSRTQPRIDSDPLSYGVSGQLLVGRQIGEEEETVPKIIPPF